jgi:hypothetical protein
MTSQTNFRYGLMFVVAMAMMAVGAVAGSVWAKGNGSQPVVAEGTHIDVFTLHTRPGVADLPVVQVVEPF